MSEPMKNKNSITRSEAFCPRDVRTKIGGKLLSLLQYFILLTLLIKVTTSAIAATGDLTFIDATKLSNAGRVVVSPDGKNIYAASTDKYNWGILSVYSRDETTGKLTLIDSETKHEDTNIGKKQAGQGSLAVSPDGNYVYMGMLTGECVLSFRRDPSTGALDFIAIADSKFGYNGSQNINSLEVSRDGEYLYTTGAGRVGVYDVDLSTGLLTEIQGIQGNSIMLATNRSRISPDGRHHYVSDINGNAIVVWDRDDATGLLNNYRRFENNTGGALIDGPNDIRFSPDGEFYM